MTYWHLVGVGGIGMSALAQMARSRGFRVSGSDRGLDHPENAALFAALRTQGVELLPQDGSFFRADAPPDALVFSTAIEEDNPDFAAAPKVKRIHRAEALRMLIENSAAPYSVAVAGSAGKTSTTAFLAEALFHLGADPECVNGGLIKAFAGNGLAGNFRAGRGPLVFEADESDKSLLAFHPDYAIVLNIGTDHYDKAELAAMFAHFLNQVRRGAVVEAEIFRMVRDRVRPDLPLAVFDGDAEPKKAGSCAYWLSGYESAGGVARAAWNGSAPFALPVPGRHTALNMLAVMAFLELAGWSPDEARQAVLRTQGVARRFDCRGRHRSGAPVIDDYAHNPEKVACCIRAAQELAPGRVWTIFQPHGYKPLGFMRGELGTLLQKTLRAEDRFFLMEPYYAGGTSSFRPHAAEVAAEWRQTGLIQTEAGESRPQVAAILDRDCASGDMILVMGARDNTLPEWAAELGGNGRIDDGNS